MSSYIKDIVGGPDNSDRRSKLYCSTDSTTPTIPSARTRLVPTEYPPKPNGRVIPPVVKHSTPDGKKEPEVSYEETTARGLIDDILTKMGSSLTTPSLANEITCKIADIPDIDLKVVKAASLILNGQINRRNGK